MVINNPPTGLIAVPMIYRYWPIITAYGIVQKTNLLLARGSFFQTAVVIMVYLLLGYEHNLAQRVDSSVDSRFPNSFECLFLPANRYLEEEQQLVRFW